MLDSLRAPDMSREKRQEHDQATGDQKEWSKKRVLGVRGIVLAQSPPNHPIARMVGLKGLGF